MKITAETIDAYVRARAKNNDPEGKYLGYPYMFGILCSTLEFAFSDPKYMRELKRDLLKLQEKGQP